jgi:hypothetical protein
MISSASPVSRRTWRMKSLALRARRQASVATSRIRRRLVLLQLLLADPQRLDRAPIEARLSRPWLPAPRPSCTDFEKLSTITN